MADDPNSADELKSLRQEVQRLRVELDGVARRLDQLQATPPAQRVAPVTPPPPPPPPRALDQIEPRRRPIFESAQSLGIDRPPIDTARMEANIGGTLMAWIAGLSLILGLGFGVYWVWTTFSFPIWTRVAGLHLVCLAILGLAAWVGRRPELKQTAENLWGVGIFALYATAYASLRLYEFWSEPVAFMEFVLITALAITVSLVTDSMGVILLGALGGYLAPFLTSSSEGNHVVLFIYLAFLNVAILGAAAIKGWSILRPITFAATAAIFVLWLDNGDFPRQAWSTEWLLLLHAAIHASTILFPALVGGRKSNGFDLWTFAGCSLGFLAGTWILFQDHPDERVWIVALALAAFEFLVARLAWLRLGAEDRLPRVALGLACTFLFLAVPLAIDDASLIGLAWCIEGAAFAAVGIHFGDRQLRVTSAIMLILGALCAWLENYMPAVRALDFAESHPYARWILLATSFLYLASGAMEWLLPRRWPWRNKTDSWGIASFFLGVGNVMLLIALTAPWRGWIVLTPYLVDIALLWSVGFLFDLRSLRHYVTVVAMTLVSIIALALVVLYEDTAYGLINARSVSLVALALIYLSAGIAYWVITGKESKQRDRDSGEWAVGIFVGLVGHLIMLLAIGLEIHYFYLDPSDPYGFPHTPLSKGELASYSVVFSFYAAVVTGLGFAIGYPFYRWFGLGLFLVVIAKVFLVDLATLSLLPRVFALLVLGITLLVTSSLYQRWGQRTAPAQEDPPAEAC